MNNLHSIFGSLKGFFSMSTMTYNEIKSWKAMQEEKYVKKVRNFHKFSFESFNTSLE